jgi:hypothetical protein
VPAEVALPFDPEVGEPEPFVALAVPAEDEVPVVPVTPVDPVLPGVPVPALPPPFVDAPVPVVDVPVLADPPAGVSEEQAPWPRMPTTAVTTPIRPRTARSVV